MDDISLLIKGAEEKNEDLILNWLLSKQKRFGNLSGLPYEF